MTLVFRAPHPGRLQQVQIGPVDVVATLAAANSVWGWVGGLTGITQVLRYGRRFSTGKDGKSPFDKPALSPATCQILTYNGVATFRDEDIAGAFGGDPSSQMLGLTICALDYELKDTSCVELFMTYLAPGLLRREVGPVDGLREILYTGLQDNVAAILNEGAARGLGERFYRAIAALGFTGAEGNTSRFNGWGQSGGAWPSDLYMIGGFLKWLGSGANGCYPTRSAAVARLAACLKEVGYRIGSILKWDGLCARPALSWGILLVIGGTSETDPYMDDGPYQFSEFVFVSHYYFATTGAMLLNSLQMSCTIPSETFQQYFEDIDREIRSHLQFEWEVRYVHDELTGIEPDPRLHMVPRWSSVERRCSRVAIRLASFHFGLSAEVLGPFYERIAGEDVLSIVKKMGDYNSRTERLPDEVVRFRVITTSICLSIIGCAAGEDYNTLQHATCLQLRKDAPVQRLAENVDKLAGKGILYSDVAMLIASIHCAQPPVVKQDTSPPDDDHIDRHIRIKSSEIIGCRKGAYAVLPNLLFSLASEPSISMLDFRCADSFIGNVPVEKDGFIRSSARHTFSYKDPGLYQTLLAQSDDEAQLMQANNNVFLGPPALRFPDTPLYLNIERPISFDEPLLGLCGRIKGEAVGNVGIPVILINLLLSLNCRDDAVSRTDPCTNHAAFASSNLGPKMLNVPASVWALAKDIKPTGDPDVHVYIPVQSSSAWTLFIAGEHECRISFGCAFCAATCKSGSMYNSHSKKAIVIGFQ